MVRKVLLRLTACVGVAILFAACNNGAFINLVFQPLEFPFADSGNIARISAFAIPNWSDAEPHNGIDLVIDETLASARIISPAAGAVTSITSSENPYSIPPGQLLVTVTIRINSEWSVYLVLEPGTVDAVLKTEQLAAILVSEGQSVEIGDPVADLIVGTLGYPHLHYMVQRNGEAVCAYAHSSDTARSVFETLATLPDGNLPDGNICYGQP